MKKILLLTLSLVSICTLNHISYLAADSQSEHDAIAKKKSEALLAVVEKEDKAEDAELKHAKYYHNTQGDCIKTCASHGGAVINNSGPVWTFSGTCLCQN